MERKWEVESAMSTLQRAEEIKKNSSLMRDVKKEAKTQAAKLMKLGGSVTKKTPVTRKPPVTRKAQVKITKRKK